MAKSNRKISGMFGNEVYKQGKHGEYVSKIARGPSKGQLAALQPQQKRMPMINKLASELNKAVEYYDGHLAQHVLFQRIKSLLFRQAENECVLMLEALRALEVSKKYKLERFNRPPVISMINKEGKALIELITEMHPVANSKFNCYYFHVILVYWRPTSGDCLHAAKKSSWIFPADGLPAFDLEFTKDEQAKEYVVFVRQVRGMNKTEEGLLPERGMMLVQVGSFDKEDQLKLDAFRVQKELLRLEDMKGVRKVLVEEERVEPKRMVSCEL